jgi:WD40 repeat protein/class 3 adenylate cyclase/energy-coupling factor transporter ATP-binding protein EcfA2
MSSLPSGTVTFLFTDIEGSTRLLRRLGERYVEVVGRHDRLVRAACAHHGGREITTQGDAFFVAFVRAGDAIAAAVRVQRALTAEHWPDGVSVRVRMGLHTGEPVIGGDNYVGLAVHRAARICAAGHGSQILLSTATRELLEDHPQPEISFRDLGEWRLKDFDRPEHLFQVVVDDLPTEFPPLASTRLQPHAAETVELPPELDAGTPLAGREADLDALREQWRCAHAGSGRLVLLAGARGIGKTRLAAELAAEVHRDRGTVLYASGAGAEESALDVLASARATQRPTLLVLDDVDRASGDVRTALGEVVGALSALRLLVVATAEKPDLVPGDAHQTIVLGPLDLEAVRAVVRLYAGERDDADVPFARLAERSGGVPLRLHRAAVEWTRTLVARRLVETASRLAAERPVLRAAEDDLAASIVELSADPDRAEPSASTRESVVCPFKGLASFDVDDAGVFFGRERLVAEMVARLTGAPLMGIVGPSGSGKSSVLRAGLLAAIVAGVLPNSERWAIALLRPGEHPMQALEDATADVAARGRLVIAVDQFEEAFTACRDATERMRFVDALVSSARDPRRRAVVLVALRADFYGRCSAYPELAKLLGANHVLVGPMQPDELRRAIELPARRVGLEVEPELVDALVADAGDEPGGLPLLSAALLELWQHREGRRLRHASYEGAGGVRGAVARLAEEAFSELGAGQQGLVRSVLLRLAGEGAGGAVVRRRIALTELRGARDEDLEAVLGVLADRRLITMSASTVEVAHEALLSEWPRLRGWLEEDAQGRRVHRHLADSARDWDERGRETSDLYRGARLAAALEWRAGHEQEPNRTERAFLDASRAAAGRAQRRLRMVLAAVAVLLAVAVAGAIVALDQRIAARNQTRVAEAQRLGVQALTEPRLDRALLLASQGVALNDSLPTRSNLLEALLRSPAAIRVMPGDGNPLSALDLSPDGRTLAAGDTRGNVLFLDAATGRRAGRPYKTPTGGISMVRFSPDGTRLAVEGDEFVDILDARTHRAYRSGLAAAPPSASTLPSALGTIAFSPDSRVLAADVIRTEPRRGTDIVRWDALTGRRLGRPRQVARTPELALVGFSARGARLLTWSAADRATVIRDAATLLPVRRLRGGGTRSALSPDGRVMAFGAEDGSVRLLDLRTGDLRIANGRHDAAVTDLRFTPDSRTLVTAGGDGRVNVWNVAQARRTETFPGHEGSASRVAIAPDGRTAYSAGQDGSVIAWDLGGQRRLDRPFNAPPRRPTRFPLDIAPLGFAVPVAGYAVTATPDGASFAAPDDAGYVDLIDSQTLTQTGRIPVSPGTQVSAVAISPDGRTVAATTTSGHLRFGDLRSRRVLGPLQRAHAYAAWSLAFGGDGRWLATAGIDPPVVLWDVRHRRIAATSHLSTQTSPTDVALSPDGKKLAAAVNDDLSGTTGIEIRSVPRLALLAAVRAPAGRRVKFSNDGRLLLYGDDQGRVWLYDTRTWRPRGRPLVAHTGAVVTVDVSPDGRTLATTSDDGTTRLWDLASGRPIGPTLPGLADHYVAAAFVDAGSHLVTLYDNGRGYLWDVQPRSWARRACRVAGRTLTRAEWNDALPERTYAPACAAR